MGGGKSRFEMLTYGPSALGAGAGMYGLAGASHGAQAAQYHHQLDRSHGGNWNGNGNGNGNYYVRHEPHQSRLQQLQHEGGNGNGGPAPSSSRSASPAFGDRDRDIFAPLDRVLGRDVMNPTEALSAQSVWSEDSGGPGVVSGELKGVGAPVVEVRYHGRGESFLHFFWFFCCPFVVPGASYISRVKDGWLITARPCRRCAECEQEEGFAGEEGEGSRCFVNERGWVQGV